MKVAKTPHGVGSATVQRIWSARGIKPHLMDTFKLSTDKFFAERLVDGVALATGSVFEVKVSTSWTRR